MGNCLRRTQDPNQPVDIAQPPSGEGGIRFPSSQSRTSTAIIKKKTPSVSLNVLQENHCKAHRCGYQHRQWKTTSASSSSQGENHINDGKHGLSAKSLPTTARDFPALKIKMDEVFHAHKLNFFCHGVLAAATRKFSEKNLIGQGGFGDVYIGYINICTMTAAKRKDGLAVAVKKLRRKGFQGQDEWQNELRFLSRLNHPNVVKLIGYCSEDEHRMLVYEYLTKGSLEDHLSNENDTELNWGRRIKIALGAARGLEHLHTYWRPVIHRDVKASNVLLDDDFNAKIADFGLAKFGPLGDNSHVSTRVLGTRGYFAPEYIATGRLTLKTDVYSFGVVLLEILSGQNAAMKHPNGVAGRWAKPYLSNKLELHKIIDEKLGTNIQIEEAREFAEIILRCLDLDPKTRPTMTEVVAYLEQIQLNTGGCYQNSVRISTVEKNFSLLTASSEVTSNLVRLFC